MALEKLLASLETEAAADTARLEAEAEQEARRIVDEARTQARALAEGAARDDEAELRQEVERRRAEARLEAAAMLREAHEDAFREFLAEVRLQLADLRERPTYPAILGALMRECLAALPAATTARFDPRDAALVRGAIGELGTKVDVDSSLASAGGVELVSDDGRTARNTIEERLRNAEPALRLLFGELLARRAGADRKTETHPSNAP